MRKLWPGLMASALATVFAVWSWPHLPERVASHWNLRGEVDGTTSRLVLVLMVPLLSFALAGILTIAPRIDPKRRNFPLHAGAYWLVANAVLGFLAVVQLLVVGYNLGWPIHLQHILLPGLGILFIVVGNVLTRVRPNWIFGIRTPWTLSSDLSWRESHRIGGYGFVLVGVLVLLMAAVHPAWAIYVLLGGLFATSAVAVVWSYFAWKRDPATHQEAN